MENRITDREQAVNKSFGYINTRTGQFEACNLRQHLIDLGIYEEPTAKRNLTPELITYFAELKARIDNLK